MIVAAHQPNFIPWLGYFDKMQRADLFVSVDHIQMEKQGFQNRTSIMTGAKPGWMTVPVRGDSRAEKIADKKIDNSRTGRFRWNRKMILTLKYAYQASPHFAAREAAVTEILDGHWERLADLNHRLIEYCRETLDIRTPMISSSALRLSGAKSDMVLNLCREVGADVYLAGSGASKSYLDVAAFERAGIEVVWQEFQHPRYRQCVAGDAFVERLSALDLIFNCGPRAAEYFPKKTPSAKNVADRRVVVPA
jgi:hypothetical protein